MIHNSIHMWWSKAESGSYGNWYLIILIIIIPKCADMSYYLIVDLSFSSSPLNAFTAHTTILGGGFLLLYETLYCIENCLKLYAVVLIPLTNCVSHTNIYVSLKFGWNHTQFSWQERENWKCCVGSTSPLSGSKTQAHLYKTCCQTSEVCLQNRHMPPGPGDLCVQPQNWW